MSGRRYDKSTKKPVSGDKAKGTGLFQQGGKKSKRDSLMLGQELDKTITRMQKASPNVLRHIGPLDNSSSTSQVVVLSQGQLASKPPGNAGGAVTSTSDGVPCEEIVDSDGEHKLQITLTEKQAWELARLLDGAVSEAALNETGLMPVSNTLDRCLGISPGQLRLRWRGLATLVAHGF